MADYDDKRVTVPAYEQRLMRLRITRTRWSHAQFPIKETEVGVREL